MSETTDHHAPTASPAGEPRPAHPSYASRAGRRSIPGVLADAGRYSILSADERLALQALIREAERKTAGEIVIVLARASDTYAGPRARLAGLVTLLVAYGLTLWLPPALLPYAILAELPLAWLLFALLGTGPLLRRIVSGEELTQRTARRAAALFLELGIVETRDRSGMLLFISEREHRVLLLGDRGVHEHVGAEGWQPHVDAMARGIREGRAFAAIAEEIRHFSELLATHFPIREGDENELPDHVIVAP